MDHRPALAHHDHRHARLGTWVLISENWYNAYDRFTKDFDDKTFLTGIGGAADFTMSRIVESFVNTWSSINHGQAAYFTEDGTPRYGQMAETLGGHLDAVREAGFGSILAGHSRGAHTALNAVAAGHEVDVLVTIDGVINGASKLAPSAAQMRLAAANSSVWANVSLAGGSWRDWDNMVARLGGRWAERARGYADYHFDMPFTHSEFGAAMSALGVVP